MTPKEAILAADELRPGNAVSERTKLMWIGGLEGRLAADVFLMAAEEMKALKLTYPDDLERELLVEWPYDDIYVLWLAAKIDEANGEFERYNNMMAAYNAHLDNFVRWFADRYRPADGYPGRCQGCGGWETPPYYLTAYGLARRAGFQGSEEEWLKSLKGEPGQEGYTPKVELENVEQGVRVKTTNLDEMGHEVTKVHLVRDGGVFVPRYTQYNGQVTITHSLVAAEKVTAMEPVVIKLPTAEGGAGEGGNHECPVPVPAEADAGKVPTAKADGGYELKTPEKALHKNAVRWIHDGSMEAAGLESGRVMDGLLSKASESVVSDNRLEGTMASNGGSYPAFSLTKIADAIKNRDFDALEEAAVSAPQFEAAVDSLGLFFLMMNNPNFSTPVILHYGTYDWMAGAQLDNPDNAKDTGTICGAMRYAVEAILTGYPTARLYISTPVYRADGEAPNTAGETLEDVADGLAKVAREYNLGLIDCYHGLGISAANAAGMLEADGTLNAAGRKRMGEYMAACLIANKVGAGTVGAEELADAINSALGKAELKNYDLLGQTPQYLPGPDAVHNIVIEAGGETKISITSDTVAELADGIDVTLAKCQETMDGGVYTLESTAETQWFSCRKTVKIPGLTPGERYELMFDATGLQQPNNDVSGPGPYGYIMVLDKSGSDVAAGFLESVGAVQRFPFTAQEDAVTINIYPTHSGIATTPGVAIRYKDLWINKATAKNVRTAIYQKELFASDRIDLRDVPGGVTIEAVPSADVYAQTVDGGKPSGPLAGKICVCFGDSITGNYAAPYDYPTIISNITGMTVINGGFGGCRMAQHPSSAYDAFSMHSLADSVVTGDWSAQDAAVGSVESAHAAKHLAALKSVTWPDVDYITIFYGTNDFAGGVALEDADNPMSTETYKGALRHAVETILTAYPKVRIVIITPMFRIWKEGDVVTDSDTHKVGDLLLPDFVAAAVDVAQEYKIPAIDVYNNLGINKTNYGAFLSDGTHPNNDGINRLGETLSARLAAAGADGKTPEKGEDTKRILRCFELLRGVIGSGVYTEDVSALLTQLDALLGGGEPPDEPDVPVVPPEEPEVATEILKPFWSSEPNKTTYEYEIKDMSGGSSATLYYTAPMFASTIGGGVLYCDLDTSILSKITVRMYFKDGEGNPYMHSITGNYPPDLSGDLTNVINTQLATDGNSVGRFYPTGSWSYRIPDGCNVVMRVEFDHENIVDEELAAGKKYDTVDAITFEGRGVTARVVKEV